MIPLQHSSYGASYGDESGAGYGGGGDDRACFNCGEIGYVLFSCRIVILLTILYPTVTARPIALSPVRWALASAAARKGECN